MRSETDKQSCSFINKTLGLQKPQSLGAQGREAHQSFLHPEIRRFVTKKLTRLKRQSYLFVVEHSQGVKDSRSGRVCACPGGQWARKNCWSFLEFSWRWPRLPGTKLTLTWGLALGGGGWGSRCLVAESSASPTLGSRTLPKPHTKKQRAIAGLVASLDRGTSLYGTSVPGLRFPGLGSRTLGAPQYYPRLAGIRTALVLTEALGRRRADGAAHRHAAAGRTRWGSLRWGYGGEERVTSSCTVNPASGLHLGLPLRAPSRREGLRSKIGTLQLFFSTTWP